MAFKGIRCTVRHSQYGDPNSGAGLLKQVTLVGENVPAIDEESEDAPAFILDSNSMRVYARPLLQPDNKQFTPYMDGGHVLVGSSEEFLAIARRNPDTSAAIGREIPIHDRCETWSDYEILSR